jgi:hypothetical protein
MMGVELKKLTVIGDADASVDAFSSSNASVTFYDCEWSVLNTGKAVC